MSESRPTPSISQVFSGFAQDFEFEAIPEAVRTRALHLILDAVGIAHAASSYEFAHRALTALQAFGGGDSDIIGMPARLSLRDAALMGNAHPNVVPYQTFRTRDGDVILAIGNDTQFARFCAGANLPQLASDTRFTTNSARITNRDALIPLIAQRMVFAAVEGCTVKTFGDAAAFVTGRKLLYGSYGIFA